jgi:hypothetical protein
MVRLLLILLTFVPVAAHAQGKYTGPDGRVRVALSKQPFSPNGVSKGPETMATGGIQEIPARMGATTRLHEARLTAPRRVAAVNRMIAGAVKGVQAREGR